MMFFESLLVYDRKQTVCQIIVSYIVHMCRSGTWIIKLFTCISYTRMQLVLVNAFAGEEHSCSAGRVLDWGRRVACLSLTSGRVTVLCP